MKPAICYLLSAICLLAILYTRVGTPARVYAVASNNLNFQARLLTGAGNIVSDGTYSVQFNLYNVASGGTTQWTETQAATTVKAGYLSVYLGSVTAFPSTIDWSQQQWLTMNVNGDGEMTPRLKLTAVPNALHANEADALRSGTNLLTADNFAQLAPSTVQVVNSALAALRLNQTGAGLLAQLQHNNSDVFTIANTGDLTSSGSATFSGGALTLGGANSTINTVSNGNLTLATNGSGVLALNTGTGGLLATNASTIQRSGATGLTIDLANAGATTLTVTNSNASNVANLSVEGGITAGTNSAFGVNGNGDVTGVMNQLDGTTTTNGSSGLTPPSTSLTLTSAINFDVGNYVQVNDVSCGGTGVNPCYAKITAKVGNVLTITPGLTWTTAKTVNEFHVPEIGGVDTSQALANRYGRGYFISGVAIGNGTTYYNEDSISSSLASFDLLSGVTGTLNVGVGANKITLGGSSTTTTFAGNVSFTGTLSGAGPSTGTSGYLQRSGTVLSPATGGDSFTTSGNISTSGTGTITASAGLTVLGGGASITGNSGVTGTLGVSSTLTISSGGASVTGGLTLLTGALNLTNGGITNAGPLAGITTITANNLVTSVGLNAGTGLIQNTGGLTSIGSISLNDTAGINTTNIGTGTTTGQITIGGGTTPLVINSTNFKVSGAGALSGITTIGLSGAITGATTANTINGLVINSGALSAITGITFTSGGLNLNSGGLTNGGAFSGLTTLGLSGAITGATAGNTINGLIISSGALSGITGITFTSGVLNLNTGGITNAGSIAGATTISASGLVTSVGHNSGTGLIQNTGGLTSTGSISLNDTAGTNTTNIGTGTTSGQITIGGGNTPLVINSTNFDVSSAGALSGITGLTVVSGGGSISGGFNNNNGGITNTGSVTGVGTNITGTGALTVASGGTSNLTFDSASNVIQIAASDTTLQRAAAGTYNIDLLNATGATTLSVTNSDATQVANLSVEGDVIVGAGKLYKVGAAQISSADLSNDTNLAKLNGTGPQTFTGNNKFSGTLLQQTDSLTAFQIQNAAGTSTVLSVDTTNSRVGIGVAAPTSALDLSGALTVRGISAPALSAPGQGRIYYDTVKNKFQSSENGGQFMDLTGFEYLGGTELVSAAATTGAITVPARDMILIIGRIPSTALPGDIPALRFNGDAGANYWDRHMKSIAGAALFTNVQNASTNMMRVGYDIQTGSRTFMLLIPNRAATSKRASDLSSLATGSAAAVGEISFGGGEWVNTSTQITTIELLSVGGKAMSIDSGFGVFGKNFP